MQDWVLRFNARGPDGLFDGKAPGPRSRLNDAQRQALVDIVERGPIPAVHGVVRWRLIDLVQWLHDEFAVSLDETNVSRELKRLGYVKLTARPRHHAQNEHALEAFKKGASLASWQRSGQPSRKAHPCYLVPGRGPGGPEEQDHATLGKARNSAVGAQGPADEVGRHLWRDLP